MNRIMIFEDIGEARQRIPVGQMRLVKIGEARICLIHTRGGFVAVEDECPHLGQSLARGTLNPFGEIICPWHSYRFSLKTGEEVERRCRNLKTYRVEEESGLYVVL